MVLFKLLAVFLLLCCAPAFGQANDIAPEPATGISQKQEVTAERYMAVTAHPLASQAAEAMLAQGGSAVDAAIAAQMVLNLVEPRSSGIGGGGFLVYYDATTGEVTTYDGRETAPKNVTEWLFYRSDDAGKPLEKMDFMDAVKSGKAVGVPGLLSMLKLAHQQQGQLPWETLFTPAIELAEEGFPASVRMVTSILYALKHKAPDGFLTLYTPAGGKQVKVGKNSRTLPLRKHCEPSPNKVLPRFTKPGLRAISFRPYNRRRFRGH